MNINVGDYLMATDRIKYVNNYIINPFQIFKIVDIDNYNLKYKVKLYCNSSIKHVDVNFEDLKGRCVKLKVEEV